VETTRVGETTGEYVADARIEGGQSHLNWAALVSGTGTSLGIWITLATLGFAIGLVAISPHNPHLKGVMIWLGIWAGIVPILATGIGSLIASWSANSMWAGTGVLYGFAVWGLSLAVGVLFTVGIAVGMAERTVGASAEVASGAVSATVKGVTGLAGAVAPGGNAMQGAAGFLKINANDLLAPVNRRLQAQGTPPVTPDQLQAALQDVANTALREGRLSQQTIVGALSRHTAMNRQEAEQVAQQVENQWNQTGGGAMRAAENAWTSTRNAALGALRSLGGGFWWMFASFALSLLGSIGGGILGTRIHRPRRRRVEHEREREHVVTTRPIGAPAHQPT
jgi:hypothetical protein